MLDRARDALQAIPPDLPRSDWVQAGMAAHAAGLDLADFDAWSAAAPSYDSRAVRDTWRSFKAGKGIGPGTLFEMAKQHGWHAPNKPTVATHRSRETPKRHGEGLTPAQVFERLQPATADHPYIAKKQGIADGLRVVPAGDQLRIAGEPMAGALAVPVIDGTGNISTLQFIVPPDTAARLKANGKPGKLNLPGHPLKGWFTVGELTPGGPVHLCEGIGQAWAVWKAVGRPAVCCFGWGRVRTVAAELHQRNPRAQLVIVPDVGKEDEAEAIARELGARFVRMPAGWPRNSDVNDLALRDGFDALEAVLAGHEAPQPAAAPFALVRIDDLGRTAPAAPVFAWEGLAPVGDVMLSTAHGGIGKSTIKLMLAVATCEGKPLFGIPTRQSNVVFYSAEDGAALIRHRLHFICKAMNVDPEALKDRLSILDATEGDPVLFAESTAGGKSEGATTATFAALREFVKAHAVGLLIIDGASDVFDGNEIRRAQVRAFIRSLANLARECNLAVVLIAHVDKGTSRGERTNTEAYSGSTAWHNSARSRLFIWRDKDGSIVIEQQKNNLGPIRDPIRLAWPKGGVPHLDEAFGPVVQGIADRGSERAMLKLIAEYSDRGEHVTTATTSRTHAARVLRQEPTFPHRMKDAEVFDLLRNAERAGHLERATYKGPDRKPRECWKVTTAGMAFAGIPAATAATAATTDVAASGANAAEPCGDCGDFAARGYGGKERTQVTAPGAMP